MEAFTVTVDTPKGRGAMDCKASSAEAAGRRVFMGAVMAGWGDMDTVTVVSVETCTDWDDQPGF